MKILKKELIKNFKGMRLFIFILVLSIVFCFQIFASNQHLNNESLAKYKKAQMLEYENPGKKDEFFVGISQMPQVYTAKTAYRIPKSISFPKDYKSEERIGREFFSIIKAAEKAKACEGRLPLAGEKDNLVAVPQIYAMDKGIKIGDKVNFFGHEVKVVGFTDMVYWNSFIITLKLARDIGLEMDRFEIQLDPDLREVEREEFLDKFDKDAGGLKLRDEFIPIADVEVKVGFITLVLVAISVLNLMFIYWHILNKRKKKYFVYRFLGMKKSVFYKLLYSELLITFLGSFAVAVLVFNMIDRIIFRKILGLVRYDLSLRSMILVFVSVLVIMAIMAFFSIRKYFNKSLLETYKGRG